MKTINEMEYFASLDEELKRARAAQVEGINQVLNRRWYNDNMKARESVPAII